MLDQLSKMGIDKIPNEFNVQDIQESTENLDDLYDENLEIKFQNQEMNKTSETKLKTRNTNDTDSIY